MDAPELRQVAALAQEVAALRDALRVQSDLALERLARAERYRSRLARVLRAATWAHNVHVREGFKELRPYGCVWSRRALDKKGETK